jgi:hypothetical protein
MKGYIGPRYFKKAAKEKLTKQLVKAMDKKKTLAALKKELQEIFNEFIRLRDTEIGQGRKFFTCISCGQPKELFEMHAGHYWPVGGHEAVRYDEDNVHGQCRHCNYFKHGNEKGYRPRLIKKIGQKAFDALEMRAHNRSKMMAFEVEYLIQEYKNKIKKFGE